MVVVEVVQKNNPTLPEEILSYVAMPFSTVIIN